MRIQEKLPANQEPGSSIILSALAFQVRGEHQFLAVLKLYNDPSITRHRCKGQKAVADLPAAAVGA